MEVAHSALDASIYIALNDGSHFKAQIVDPKISSQKWSLCRDKEISIVKWFLSLSLNSYCGLQFPIATYFHVIFFDLSRNNLTLSRHSSIDVFCFTPLHGCLLSRQKFCPSALQLCCNILYYVVTFFMLLFSIYVTIDFSLSRQLLTKFFDTTTKD